MPPGTILLSEARQDSHQVVLHPVPTSDPNDPLNWSTWRKYINFSLILVYVFFTFVLLNIGSVAYGSYVQDLAVSYSDYNTSIALVYAGLAVGCWAFIPFVYRYGRRPFYLVSLLIQLASAVWAANMTTSREFLATNALIGFGGAISETLVQITLADTFFVHQYATMNALYLFVQATGSFLGPVAGGYIISGMGWRWIFWWTAIFIGATFIAGFFLAEETSYVPNLTAHPLQHSQDTTTQDLEEKKKADIEAIDATDAGSVTLPKNTRKPLRQRLALITKNDVHIKPHFYQPFSMLIRIPAIMYVTLTFGSLLSWYSAMFSVAASMLPLPPYNFTVVQVGLFFLAPFVGAVIATPLTGPLSDWMILRLAKRNNGVYEPEMRLYPAFIGGILTMAGILMFGMGIVYGAPWILLAVGVAIYTLGFISCTDIALAYLIDSYVNIIGDAMVGIGTVRNLFAVIVLFGLGPWIEGMGLRNFFILLSAVAFAILLIPVLLLIWGKKIRSRTAEVYRHYASRQPMRRD
ncbi:major facilitator superfamily domain-containing protein [Ilyonectria sp. MPI-CAGE-AT-0026]|nr:major facilitator superfamily domain-containing protein [Ilyonectria sp. MPI-CAGE-AT-0026]